VIKLIALVDENFGISKNEEIPWSFREDRIFFYQKTNFSTVVMGRKTFDSIGGKPLKNRINCVLSRNVEHLGNSVEVFSSPAKLVGVHKDFWVIGGAEIFNYFLRNKLVDYALITKIHRDCCADKFVDASLLEQMEVSTLKRADLYTIYQYTQKSASTKYSASSPIAACGL
jgi:dihydrofolate reductase